MEGRRPNLYALHGKNVHRIGVSKLDNLNLIRQNLSQLWGRENITQNECSNNWHSCFCVEVQYTRSNRNPSYRCLRRLFLNRKAASSWIFRIGSSTKPV